MIGLLTSDCCFPSRPAEALMLPLASLFTMTQTSFKMSLSMLSQSVCPETSVVEYCLRNEIETPRFRPAYQTKK
jgi:hypothetical protein